MARRASKQVKDDEDRAVKLSHAISEVVLNILKRRGMTQAALAAGIGMSRAGLCQAINAQDASRLWRPPAISGICRVLEIREDELFSLAVKWSESNAAGAVKNTLWIYTIGTELGSPERLQEIICSATGDTPERNSVRLFQIGCRKFVDDYASGVLTDESALSWLRQAEDERNAEEVENKRLPLWAMVAEMYGKPREGR